MLQQSTQCQQCVQLQWFDSSLSQNGLYNGVRVDGVGRLVSITEVAAAVPEPSSYALMLAGVAAIGVAVRRRKAGAALKA
ncbi:PEP-CTERM sorting domain-containing protein [Mitsuaria sp. TWR114]|nr:PEP-CTERM sorting domain-containing protein [Mitsuaria sp. TWR114]